MEKRGKTESEAIQMAIGIVKNWAAGKGNVDANTRAAAAKALKEWEALKATNAASSKVKETTTVRYLGQDLTTEEVANLAVLEAASDDAKKPSVYCVKDGKKVTPTDEGKCPDCGTDLSKAVSAAKKVMEAVLSAFTPQT